MKTAPPSGSGGRRLRAILIKEFLQIVRDPSSILMAFVLPLILLFIFGYGVSLDAKRIRLGVVLEDGGAAGLSLAQAFEATPYFETRRSRDFRTLEGEMAAGRLRGIVTIPTDFSRRLQQPGTPAELRLVTDGGETNTATFVQNYAQGVLQQWGVQQRRLQATRSRVTIQVVPRILYNPELDSRRSLIPGALAIIMAIIGTLLTALVVAREWERGTMETMLATPVGILELVLGKLIPYFLLGMGSMLFSTAVAVLLFEIPFRGSAAALGLCSATFLLCALGQGLLISTLAKNQFVAAQAAIISGFLPAFLLSGFVFDIASMPWPVQKLTCLVPARYLVTCLQTIFLTGDVWPLLLPNLGAMLLIATVFFTLTARKTSRRLM